MRIGFEVSVQFLTHNKGADVGIQRETINLPIPPVIGMMLKYRGDNYKVEEILCAEDPTDYSVFVARLIAKKLE